MFSFFEVDLSPTVFCEAFDSGYSFNLASMKLKCLEGFFYQSGFSLGVGNPPVYSIHTPSRLRNIY